ncbi:MAG TPA: class I SAM-dependent methyltransferase [Terriglobia bacterium]|nr:class I SAM-dependent methyltransferase [Terriglobia bacterium]
MTLLAQGAIVTGPSTPRRRCLICHSADPSEYALVYRVPEFEVIRCKRCELTFIDSETGLEPEVGEYPLEQYLHLETMYRSKARHDFAELERVWRSVNGSGHAPVRLLDIGCGVGMFVEESARHGWHPEGVDVNRVAVGYANDQKHLRVFLQDAEGGLPFEPDSFDVVTLFGVIEHLQNPGSLLVECRRVLRRGGMAVAQTPTEDGLLRRCGRWLFRWSGGKVTFPAYQFYQLHGGHSICFSRKSLGRLLAQLDFEVRESADSTYGLSVLLHRFHQNPLPSRLWKSAGTAAVFALGRIIGRSNHMTVFAVKR